MGRQTGTVKFFDNAEGVGIAVNQNGEDVLLSYKHMLDTLAETLDVLDEITFDQAYAGKMLEARKVSPAD